MALEHDGVFVVDAARVLRVFRHEGREVRHHVRVEVGHAGARAEAVLAPA